LTGLYRCKPYEYASEPGHSHIFHNFIAKILSSFGEPVIIEFALRSFSHNPVTGTPSRGGQGGWLLSWTYASFLNVRSRATIREAKINNL
jgi:hypothetical protein